MILSNWLIRHMSGHIDNFVPTALSELSSRSQTISLVLKESNDPKLIDIARRRRAYFPSLLRLDQAYFSLFSLFFLSLFVSFAELT